MPKQTQFVIKLNASTSLYLLNPYSENYSDNTWGAVTHPDLMIRYTQAEVDEMAAKINSGTIGTPKPQN